MSDFSNQDAETGANLPEHSVSELSQAIKRTLEGRFERVRVRGEISGFKRAASGHLYMALKDENAVLDAVCWRGLAGRLTVVPEDGLEVVCGPSLIAVCTVSSERPENCLINVLKSSFFNLLKDSTNFFEPP